MRRQALNLLTSSATLVLLALLTLPAQHVLSAASSSPDGASAHSAPRLFGVYVDPWHVDDWARRIGARPQLVAKFEAFSRRRPLEPFLTEAERQGVRDVLVSWEPWRPVPAGLGADAQRRQQPGYRNADIAAGVQDGYIRRVALALAGFDGQVYLRFAHEMNGFWYPWSRDARSYVRAWRHVVRLFRESGARNVRFVWSVNPSLYETPAAWRTRLRRYWPGRRYVDDVGSTMINFGGVKHYDVPRFLVRLRILRRVYGKRLMLTEVNTEHEGRVKWLIDLRRALRDNRWISAVAWSQLPSRGKAHAGTRFGTLNWDVRRDPAAAAAVRGIMRDGSG